MIAQITVEGSCTQGDIAQGLSRSVSLCLPMNLDLFVEEEVKEE